ncbi:MAG: S8 family serine peptidase [Paludibacter sp.]|nr:S8 family serine peptidase [Paludibacter sp.]MDD4198975.1 S8 family serine peptidase [Paludibacter sp.]MDD4427824.1 S8 family serine peptidase [Paludibacter sp.]
MRTIITIGIIDQGVDLDHPDLAANLLAGYDATDGGNGGINGDCWSNDAHGTCCAGIIAAIDNTIGIKGVAPNCKIIPIRVTYTLYGYQIWDDDWIVDAINYAWEVSEADIISCSWGGGTVSVPINNEISNALVLGRNNLGCIVVFSAGNSNNAVLYPANSNPAILAVGAISYCGERKSPSSCDGEEWYRGYPYYDYLGGSNYGSQLDLVAPGVKIYTTDIQGTAGYNTSSGTAGNYYSSFNGTSSACPHVAGVAALMLSMRPDLTGQQVRDVIEQTTQKVGNYSYTTTVGRPNGIWHEQMGYGLVNAYAAVYAVAPRISGPSSFSGQATYTLQNLPAGATVQWSVNDMTYLDLISQNERGDSAVFQGDYYGFGIIYATITVNNIDIVISRYVYTDIDLTPLNNCYISALDFACGMASFTMSNLPELDSEVRWSCDAGIGYTYGYDPNPTYYFSTSAYPDSRPGVDKMKAQITYKGKTQEWEHEFNFNFNRPYVYYPVGDTILSDYGFYSNNGLAAIDVQYNYPFSWMSSEWSAYGWGWHFVDGSNEFATFEGPTGVPDIMIELCFDTPCGGRTCYQREFAVPQSLYSISASAFSLYPNPASDNVTISLADDTKGHKSKTTMVAASSSDNYEIQLWNPFGLVKQVTTDQPKYQLSLSGVPAGFYYVHVIKNNLTYRKQLIIK